MEAKVKQDEHVLDIHNSVITLDELLAKAIKQLEDLKNG